VPAVTLTGVKFEVILDDVTKIFGIGVL